MTRKRKQPPNSRWRARGCVNQIPGTPCHELMKELYKFARDQELPYSVWAHGSGIAEESLRNRWRRGRNPSFLGVIAAGQYLGYQLKWEKIPSMWPEVPQDPKGPTEDNYFVGSLLEGTDD